MADYEEMKQLEGATARIDHLYQEGVYFGPSDIKTMELCALQLLGMVKDFKFGHRKEQLQQFINKG